LSVGLNWYRALVARHGGDLSHRRRCIPTPVPEFAEKPTPHSCDGIDMGLIAKPHKDMSAGRHIAWTHRDEGSSILVAVLNAWVSSETKSGSAARGLSIVSGRGTARHV